MSGHLTNYFRSLTHHQFTHQIKVEGVDLKTKLKTVTVRSQLTIIEHGRVNLIYLGKILD